MPSTAFLFLVICLLIIIPPVDGRRDVLLLRRRCGGARVVLIPLTIEFSSYQRVFSSTGYMNSFINSMLVTVVSTVLSMVLTTTMAYALSQRELIFQASSSTLCSPPCSLTEASCRSTWLCAKWA